MVEIITLEMLQEEAKEIQAFTDQGCEDDIYMVEQRGSRLQAYISRTGKMLADAKKLLNQRKKDDIIQALEKYYIKGDAPKITINELIKSLCAEEQYAVDWLERLNRTCVHESDWCRTLISKYKEEIRMATFGGGNP